MAVDVRELRSTDRVMVKDGVHLAGHDLHVVAAQQRLGLVAAIRQKPRRTRGDRAFTDGDRLGKDALSVDLVTPFGVLAHAPARRRERKPMHGTAAATAESSPSPNPGNQRPEINLLDGQCL